MPSTRKQAKSTSPKRNQKGQYLPGQTGNAGGLSTEARELRKAFLGEVPAALKLVRKWLKSKKFQEQRTAVATILERGLGLPGKGSELPDTEPLPEVPPEAGDTATLLQQVRHMLARSVEGLRARQASGEFGLEDVASLGKLGHTLGELLKVEKEANRASDLSKLSDEELLDLLFGLLPMEKLEAALKQRKAKAPAGEKA